jgi:stage IV sporulation protein B
MKKISAILVTTILFTTLSFKTINAEEDVFEYSDNEAIVSGQVIGIHYQLDEYYVQNTFSKMNPIMRGSILKKITYKDPETNKTISFVVKNDPQVKELYKLDDDLKINIIVQRKDKLEIVSTNVYHIRHTQLQNTVYSYATLTSINPTTFEYSAVAHPIDVGGNTKYTIKKGFIFLADTVYNAKKSKSFSRGNIDADISDKPIGTINITSNVGIKGVLTDINAVDGCSIYAVAKYSEIELGDAYILSQDNKTNKIIKSKIEVTEIEKPNDKIRAGTVYFKVVDKHLIKERGGTVRGMSGSPIIQNGKIIGALSHGNLLFSKEGRFTYIGYMIGLD